MTIPLTANAVFTSSVAEHLMTALKNGYWTHKQNLTALRTGQRVAIRMSRAELARTGIPPLHQPILTGIIEAPMQRLTAADTTWVESEEYLWRLPLRNMRIVRPVDFENQVEVLHRHPGPRGACYL